jgi:hypothetical protein
LRSVALLQKYPATTERTHKPDGCVSRA